jgi:hypothetical protein
MSLVMVSREKMEVITMPLDRAPLDRGDIRPEQNETLPEYIDRMIAMDRVIYPADKYPDLPRIVATDGWIAKRENYWAFAYKAFWEWGWCLAHGHFTDPHAHRISDFVFSSSHSSHRAPSEAPSEAPSVAPSPDDMPRIYRSNAMPRIYARTFDRDKESLLKAS